MIVNFWLAAYIDFSNIACKYLTLNLFSFLTFDLQTPNHMVITWSVHKFLTFSFFNMELCYWEKIHKLRQHLSLLFDLPSLLFWYLTFKPWIIILKVHKLHLSRLWIFDLLLCKHSNIIKKKSQNILSILTVNVWFCDFICMSFDVCHFIYLSSYVSPYLSFCLIFLCISIYVILSMRFSRYFSLYIFSFMFFLVFLFVWLFSFSFFQIIWSMLFLQYNFFNVISLM